jgi:hypothetical protein
MQLTLPDGRVVIRVEVREDGLVQGEVDVDAHREEFLLASGQFVSLPVSSLLGAAQPLRSVSP